ncbi:hypothetical protein BGZ96_000248, partial [Linnemannia gamsii]
MTDHPLYHIDSHAPDVNDSKNSPRLRIRDKVRELLCISKAKIKSKGSSQSMNAQYSSQQTSKQSSGVIQASNKSSSALPRLHHLHVSIFLENIPAPALKAELPRLHERITRTEQLLYCNILLQQSSLIPPSMTTDDNAIEGSAEALQEPLLDKSQMDWLAEIKKEPLEQDHMHWLIARMVEEFIGDSTKDATKIAEIVSLGTILQREIYRKLLSSIIKEFDDARILDVQSLQGLVQLVRFASAEYLVSDDLVKILSILRIHLQGTHQQSTEHLYHLTLAVSQVLDIMADHKVRGVNRVIEHEPLSAVLSSLKDSSDPYLLYQVCYAFQALQYVPNDETALRAVWRHSAGVVDGFFKVSGVLKLDLNVVLDGLGSLQKMVVDAIEVAGSAYQGVCSLLESGRGVLDSLKEGLGAGQKHTWYPAVRAAFTLARAGQLKDLNQLIYKAPCRNDPLFQWGICQLLADIATDPIWDVNTRQQTVCLLGHLYKNDDDWARDGSVKAWMLTIINKLAANSDKVISSITLTLQQELSAEETPRSQHPHPLTSRLFIPESSPVLVKVQRIPYVERKLHLMKRQRLTEVRQSICIPPMAMANLEAHNDQFPLMDKVREFLASDQQVMLILGDSGSGKSTFNKHLEFKLLQSYRSGSRIPLFIDLPSIERPDRELIPEQLRAYRFSKAEIEELERHRQFILICDGYDESQLKINLHTTNQLNRNGQRDTKLIITCRTQYLCQDYINQFVPEGGDHYDPPAMNLFQEVFIAPFSKEQIKSYVDQYVSLKSRNWSTRDYMSKLAAIPDLMDLAKNPFLLSLSLEALPLVTEGKQDLSTIQVSHVQLYDTFVHHWLDVNKRRLQRNILTDDDRAILNDLLDAGFNSEGIAYCTKLASAIFVKQNGNPIVQYSQLNDKSTWKAEFFGQDSQARLLQKATPLTRSGKQYQFLHKTMLEYFVSRAIYEPNKQGDNCGPDKCSSDGSPGSRGFDSEGVFSSMSLRPERSILEFLSQRVSRSPVFEGQLRALIQRWGEEHYDDHLEAPIAVTNAAYILISADKDKAFGWFKVPNQPDREDL